MTHRSPLHLLALLAAPVAVGCGGAGHDASTIRAQTIVSLEQIAAGDLRCGSVDVADLGNGNWLARGCGREATYRGGCDGEQCWWDVLSTSGGQSPALAEPPPAPPVSASPPPADPVEYSSVPVVESPLYAELPPCSEPDEYVDGTFEDDTVVVGLGEPCRMEVPQEITVMQSTVPPPAEPIDEVLPPAPAQSSVWIDGYWYWTGVRYVWAPGYWADPPRAGYVYVRGSWGWYDGYWQYRPGGWARRGTTVILAPPPRRPWGVARVHPAPRYRAYPNRRVIVRPAHPVHVRPAPHRRDVRVQGTPGRVRVQGGAPPPRSGGVRVQGGGSVRGTTRVQGGSVGGTTRVQSAPSPRRDVRPTDDRRRSVRSPASDRRGPSRSTGRAGGGRSSGGRGGVRSQ